jgi:hypothetical protein
MIAIDRKVSTFEYKQRLPTSSMSNDYTTNKFINRKTILIHINYYTFRLDKRPFAGFIVAFSAGSFTAPTSSSSNDGSAVGRGT